MIMTPVKVTQEVYAMSVKKQKSEKLQKVLARCGYGSRREIESFIQSGRISVDGQLATLGDRIEVKANTKIRLDGHLLRSRKQRKAFVGY